MTNSRFEVTVLGCGTSMGVPVLGCYCHVCRSDDPKNHRLRSSIFIRRSGKESGVLIDASPDFRTQALRARLKEIDAVLFSHAHADHILGIEDLRGFTFRKGEKIPCFVSETTEQEIRHIFHYIFEARPDYEGGTVAQLSLETLLPFTIPETRASLDIIPIPIFHGSKSIFGFRIGDFAYLTDCSKVSPESLRALKGITTLLVGALRHEPHPTHFSVSEALELSATLQNPRTYLTHTSHALDYHETCALLPPHASLAFDGLVIEGVTK
jgi:phosphoribosyl 1,2-cyclic phosphate phosphodiesterase